MWTTAITLLSGVWSNKKLLAYGFVILLYPVLYFVGDLHGHRAEKLSYYKATNTEAVAQQEQQAKENAKEANKAIAQESEVSKDITQLNSSKEQVKQKINDLAKDNPCNSNKLSDNELQYINKLIENANK